MMLKFLAAGASLVSIPGPRAKGQPARYAGRKFVPASPGVRAAYPATEKPFEVDGSSVLGKRLAHICRRDGTLFPVDDETARVCGVQKPVVKFAEGAWTSRAPTAQKPAKASQKTQAPARDASPTPVPKESPTDG